MYPLCPYVPDSGLNSTLFYLQFLSVFVSAIDRHPNPHCYCLCDVLCTQWPFKQGSHTTHTFHPCHTASALYKKNVNTLKNPKKHKTNECKNSNRRIAFLNKFTSRSLRSNHRTARVKPKPWTC